MSGQGHNSAGADIRSYFDRWSRLEDDRDVISKDMKELFAEAKATGLNTKALRAAFRIERQNQDATKRAERQELDETVEMYRAALFGTSIATRTRAKPEPPHDPTTGEITENPSAVPHSPDDGRGAPVAVSDAASTHSEFSAPSIGTVSPHNDGEANANTGGSDDRTQVGTQLTTIHTEMASGSVETSPAPIQEPPSPSGGEQGGGAVDEQPRQEGSPAPDDEDIPAFLDRRNHTEHPA